MLVVIQVPDNKECLALTSQTGTLMALPLSVRPLGCLSNSLEHRMEGASNLPTGGTSGDCQPPKTGPIPSHPDRLTPGRGLPWQPDT